MAVPPVCLTNRRDREATSLTSFMILCLTFNHWKKKNASLYGFLKVSSHLPSENLLYPLRKNSDTPFSVSHCPGLPGLLSPSVQRFSRQQHFHISSSLPYPTKQQTIHLFNVKIKFHPSLSGAAPPLLLIAISTSRSTYPS